MIKRELARFLLVGSLTVLVDFISYYGLIEYKTMEVDIAKAIGFINGTIFAYFANRFWTFGNKKLAQGSIWRFTILYASTLGANVLINALALVLFANTGATIQAAFLVATILSASLNFLGMKYIVFRENVDGLA